MLRRFIASCLALILVCSLSACNKDIDIDSALQELADRQQDMKSYLATGTLTLYTGKEPVEYGVDVWYKQADFYRVALGNKNNDITQILLKNTEGSYILTPQLNKSFHFTNDWPEKPSSLYLYQANISNILKDSKRSFVQNEEGYLFQVESQFRNNPNWDSTKILLDKSLYPKHIEVLDQEGKTVAKMNFTTFKYDVQFDQDAFDVNKSINVLSLNKDMTQTVLSEHCAPSYIPAGTELAAQHRVSNDQIESVISRYHGTYNFTLTVGKPKSARVRSTINDIVPLHKAMGVLSENNGCKSLSWLDRGLEFELKGDLSLAELEKIANSI